MRRFLLVAALLAGLLAAAVFVIARGPDDSPAPYLYYLDKSHDALIVERADGSDSRRLAAGLMTSSVQPAWSPSGRWFAWGNAWCDWSCSFGATYAVPVDGGAPLAQVNGLINARFAWSPVDDLLLVADVGDTTLYAGRGPAFHETRFLLVDAAAGETLVALSRYPNGMVDGSTGITPLHWTPGGEAVSFAYGRLGKDGGLAWNGLITVWRDGRWKERKVWLHSLASTSYVSSWYSGDWLIYHPLDGREVDLTTLIAENVVSGAVQTFALPDDNPDGMSIEWNDDGYGVLTMGADYAWTPPAQLWRLSLHDGSLTFVSTLSEQMMSISQWVEWSPDRKAVVFKDGSSRRQLELATGAVTEVQDAPAPTPYVSWYDREVVSPDGSYRLVSREDNRFVEVERGYHYRLPANSASYYRLVSDILWHADGTWLVKQDRSSEGTEGCCCCASTVMTLTGGAARELGEGYVDWLPERVVPHLAPGAAESVLLAPEQITVLPDGDRLNFYPAGQTNVTATCEREGEPFVLLNDPVSGSPRYRLNLGEPCNPRALPNGWWVAANPRLPLLASIAFERDLVRLWDLETGRQLYTLNSLGFDLWFSDDGTKLLTRSRSAVLTWDVAEILRRAGR